MNEAPLVLSQQGILRVDAPSSIGGKYFMGVAEFGVPYTFPGLSGELVHAIEELPVFALAELKATLPGAHPDMHGHEAHDDAHAHAEPAPAE